MIESNQKLCPSSSCADGSILLGVVQGDSTVVLLNAGFIVDEQFVKAAREAGDPEKRFRFAGKCIKAGCPQWTGGNCGVIETLSKINENMLAGEDTGVLKPCIIRNRCRWYSEEGKIACTLCTYIVTDYMEEGADKHNITPLRLQKQVSPG
ncbi:MAG TPA: hypothetical protein VFE53_11310 [Mucilaginibacter sp.]|jgi:hypothetical protein|nr:hypothetical protein [Mucilaginibacter sp.]